MTILSVKNATRRVKRAVLDRWIVTVESALSLRRVRAASTNAHRARTTVVWVHVRAATPFACLPRLMVVLGLARRSVTDAKLLQAMKTARQLVYHHVRIALMRSRLT